VFSAGEFVSALAERLAAESLTPVLYPDDSTIMGQGLRFVQEYFLVACSIADLVRRFRRNNTEWSALPDKVAVQLNDTHPSMTVAELMRVLLDEAGLGWDQAWDLTRRTLAYTNHTLLPEALEKWPQVWFELMLPRHLEIILEIERLLLDEARVAGRGAFGRCLRSFPEICLRAVASSNQAECLARPSFLRVPAGCLGLTCLGVALLLGMLGVPPIIVR
jgi:starch phosphorylase